VRQSMRARVRDPTWGVMIVSFLGFVVSFLGAVAAS
jgi:hypothetical protein